MRDDGDAIAKGLTDQLERMIETYDGSYREVKGTAYLSAKSPKDLGSFQVHLVGARRGQWYRHSQQVGGGVISLLAYLLKGCTGEPTRSDLADAFKEARVFLGMDSGEVDHEAANRARKEREERRRLQEVDAERERERKEELALDLWQHAVAPEGTLAEVYFRSRVKLWDGFHTDAIRFHPSAYYAPRVSLPCVVCRVDGEAHDPIGVWRIFLNSDGTNFVEVTDGKAKKVKKGLGPCLELGGSIRLFPVTSGVVGTTEGVETGYGAWRLNNRELPIWPTMCATGMENFRPPFEVERVWYFPDGDSWKYQDKHQTWLEPTGMRAALKGSENLRSQGIQTGIQPPPAPGRDFLDEWNSEAAELTEAA